MPILDLRNHLPDLPHCPILIMMSTTIIFHFIIIIDHFIITLIVFGWLVEMLHSDCDQIGIQIITSCFIARCHTRWLLNCFGTFLRLTELDQPLNITKYSV